MTKGSGRQTLTNLKNSKGKLFGEKIDSPNRTDAVAFPSQKRCTPLRLRLEVEVEPRLRVKLPFPCFFVHLITRCAVFVPAECAYLCLFNLTNACCASARQERSIFSNSLAMPRLGSTGFPTWNPLDPKAFDDQIYKPIYVFCRCERQVMLIITPLVLPLTCPSKAEGSGLVGPIAYAEMQRNSVNVPRSGLTGLSMCLPLASFSSALHG